MKSAETCAFKKKALGMAKKATKAIPNSKMSENKDSILIFFHKKKNLVFPFFFP